MASQARRGINLSVDLSDFDKFRLELEDMRKNFLHNVAQKMWTYDMLVEEGSRALAPRDGGDLESSIKAEATKIEGDRVIGSVGSNLEYALRVHEEPGRRGRFPKYDAGVKEDDYYQDGLGRRTRQKSAWRGELPGRKYLERAVVATEDDFDRFMAESLERTLKGDRL